MALKLTVILLVLLFAVLQFAGRDVDGGPFAEAPGADPGEVLLAVAPLDTVPTRPAPTPPAAPEPTAPPAGASNDALDESLGVPAIVEDTASPSSGQSALDLVILDPSAARDSLTIAPEAVIDSLAPAVQQSGIDSLNAGAPAPNSALNMAEVTGSSVNLRAGPSTGNAVLGRAQGGDLVEWVSDPAPGWALIRHPNIDGDLYMSSQFLRRVSN